MYLNTLVLLSKSILTNLPHDKPTLLSNNKLRIFKSMSMQKQNTQFKSFFMRPYGKKKFFFLKSSFTIGCHVHFWAHYKIRGGMFCEESWENEALWFKRTRGHCVPSWRSVSLLIRQTWEMRRHCVPISGSNHWKLITGWNSERNTEKTLESDDSTISLAYNLLWTDLKVKWR